VKQYFTLVYYFILDNFSTVGHKKYSGTEFYIIFYIEQGSIHAPPWQLTRPLTTLHPAQTHWLTPPWAPKMRRCLVLMPTVPHSPFSPHHTGVVLSLTYQPCSKNSFSMLCSQKPPWLQLLGTLPNNTIPNLDNKCTSHASLVQCDIRLALQWRHHQKHSQPYQKMGGSHCKM